MNSDPTGNFTLVGLSVSTILQRTLKGAANGAVLGGFFSMIDALLDGERDPLQAFADGAKSGLVVGAVFGNFTAFAKLSTSKIVAVTAKLAMGSLLSVGGVGGIVGAVDSFKKGNYVQGAYRAAFSYLCFRGAYRQFGGAYNTATNNSNSLTNTSSKSPTSNSNNGKYQSASLFERITTRTAKVSELKPNPFDEFSDRNGIRAFNILAR